MIEPVPSARQQIVAIVAAQPGITSAIVADALPTIDRRSVCAHLATLAQRGRLAREKVDGSWHYRAADGAAAADSSDLEDDDDDDDADTPAAPATRITTHVAEAPRRPGRVTATEAARRAADAAHETRVEIAPEAQATPQTAAVEALIRAASQAAADKAQARSEPAPIDDALRFSPAFSGRAHSVGGDLRASIDDDGSIAISLPEIGLRLNPAQTRQLGDFMSMTIALWSRP